MGINWNQPKKKWGQVDGVNKQHLASVANNMDDDRGCNETLGK